MSFESVVIFLRKEIDSLETQIKAEAEIFRTRLKKQQEQYENEIADKNAIISELAWSEDCEHEFCEVKNHKVCGVKMCIHCFRVERLDGCDRAVVIDN